MQPIHLHAPAALHAVGGSGLLQDVLNQQATPPTNQAPAAAGSVSESIKLAELSVEEQRLKLQTQQVISVWPLLAVEVAADTLFRLAAPGFCQLINVAGGCNDSGQAQQPHLPTA